MEITSGKVYNLFGKNGIEEVKNTGLNIGQIAQIKYEDSIKGLLKEYKYLELKEFSNKSNHALAAKNIKTELKRIYPNTKFTVKSDSYSGGNSVHIDWTNGATSEMVNKIVDKYQEGDFNGMEDIYEYNSSAFNNIFGGVKYVIAQRHITNDKHVETAKEYGYNITFTERNEMIFKPEDIKTMEDQNTDKWDMERRIYRESYSKNYYI